VRQLTRSEKRFIILLIVACAVLAVIIEFWPRPRDPLTQPTELYPHVNAGETFRVDPAWPPKTSTASTAGVTGVAVASDGHVWVVGHGRPPVREYDANGQYLRGWGDGEMETAHQIRLDHDGSVWIADCGRHCIHKFRPDGTRLLTLGTPGQPGEDATHFHEPTDMAIMPDGDVFVADGYVNARVAHFHGDGTFVKAWGNRGSKPGQFSLVHNIVADSRGRLLVADRNNARIQVFDRDGNFLTQWQNLVVPWGLWLTPKGELWVCGSSPAVWKEKQYALATPPHDQLLMRFDLDGRLMQLWAVPVGNEPGQLNWAHGIASDAQGNLYCGDYRGMRVQKFVRVTEEQR
jgi:DNA-binding beta-propeller fold protein YncE